jgi:hypothetical protein
MRSISLHAKLHSLSYQDNTTQEIRPVFREQVREQITCIDRYFARRNYVSVNKEITATLLRLANTQSSSN